MRSAEFGLRSAEWWDMRGVLTCYRGVASGVVAWLVLFLSCLCAVDAVAVEQNTLNDHAARGARLSQREREGAGEERTWTEVDGRTMRAVFLREVDGDATFLQGGKLVTMPLERLSEADRRVIRQIEEARAKAEPAPEAKAAEASPFSERGNSQVFEEMRSREERRRVEQGEGVAERRQETGDRGQEPVARSQETVVSNSEQPASGVASEPAREAETPAATKPLADAGGKQKTLWVAVIILVGVLGTVAILVGLVGAMGAR